jgi:hypothetical protein
MSSKKWRLSYSLVWTYPFLLGWYFYPFKLISRRPHVQAGLVMECLQMADCFFNVCKSVFVPQELEYFWYSLTKKGLLPHPKKLEVILRLTAPKSKCEPRWFLGMVNYYGDVWWCLMFTLIKPFICNGVWKDQIHFGKMNSKTLLKKWKQY